MNERVSEVRANKKKFKECAMLETNQLKKNGQHINRKVASEEDILS